MDIGPRTPLLDAFKQGEVPRDVREMAAQGALAPRAHEQLALLMLLSEDKESDIAQTAERTLKAIPVASLSAFLARSDVPEEMRVFFAARGVEPSTPAEGDVEAPMLEVTSGIDPVEELDVNDPSTLQKIAAMNVAQRMSAAMKGTREMRAMLIRDPNRIVSAAVLSSPKLTDTEVEAFARMGSVAEESLRIIARNRAWMKRYGIVLALTKNPKTPVALSMNLMARLSEKDLRMLSSDRNVPDALRVAARQKIVLHK